MNKQGLTLIELLIVIGIIGILAGVAITSYVGTMLKADRAEAYTNLESLKLLEEQFFAEISDFAPAGGGTINYNATPGVADGGIEDELPGFQPGGCTGCAAPFGLKFTYQITQDVALQTPVPVPYGGATVGQTPCFVAIATAVAGTRPGNQVPPDVFAIDCNNNKNF